MDPRDCNDFDDDQWPSSDYAKAPEPSNDLPDLPTPLKDANHEVPSESQR